MTDLAGADTSASGLLFDELFVGIPYRLGGSGFDGCDCAGLVHLYYRRRGIVLEMPIYGSDWEDIDGGIIDREIRSQLQCVDDPKHGDVVAFIDDGVIRMVGIHVGYGKAVIARKGRRSQIYRINRMRFEEVGYFRG